MPNIYKDKMEEIVVRCNMCENSLIKGEEYTFKDYYGLINATFTTGYYSDDFPDGFRYTFSLCESCLRTLFCKFKIQPNKKDLFGWGKWEDEI